MTAALRIPMPLAEALASEDASARIRLRSLIQAAKRQRARKLARSLPRRQDEAAQAKRETERHAALVRQVMDRPGPDCELGAHSVADGTSIEPHHLEMGSTKSRNERLSNVIRACQVCHRAYHLNEATFVAWVKSWASRHGYQYPNRRAYREDAP